MKPIFREEIEFLKLDIPKETCFMDRNIIKAFDENNKLIRLYRLKIENNEITISKYNDKFVKLKMWNELIDVKRLEKLEKDSIETTKILLDKYNDSTPFICHSGGKDSTVTAHIVKKVKNDIPIMFNNTSNESADTYKYIKKLNNIHIVNPKEGFWQMMKRENFVPSKFARKCCVIYKHDTTLEFLDKDKKYLLFMGMRNDESVKRAKYKTEHRFNYYPDEWVCGLPIREWNEWDIWSYILYHKLEFNNVYRYGYKRCGCIICPNRTPYEDVLTRNYFPNQVKRFEVVQRSNFFAYQRWTNLNCTLQEFINGAWKGGKVRSEPTSEVIKEFAEYKGISTELASKYFNQKCSCGANINDIAVGLNMKYNGRNTKEFRCLKCLAKEFGKTQKQLKEIARQLKIGGCELF